VIQFERFELANGLRVLVHEDNSTPMAAVNVLYNVGSRDENPQQTGFAHLFEHLMFGGSANIPDFDDPLQMAGGENNAFTNSDYTNFYDILPVQNLETALWLESDRMLSLNFDEQVLDVERKVVVEEFKETCLNQPYGDSWHLLSALAYKAHPYRWPTIGLLPEHVESANMDDVRNFFFHHYRPNNAILVVSGNIKPAKVKKLVEKWFGDIPAGLIPHRQLPQEPPQQQLQEHIQEANVPIDAIFLAFHMVDRLHPDYYVTDLLSDVLSNGPSSRLFRRLLKEKQLFSSIDCYLSGTIDAGLVIIEGKPAEGVSLEQAEAAIWAELHELTAAPIPETELEKWKNKVESILVFSELSVLNKAQNLAFFELIGDADLINSEAKLYQQITTADLHRVAQSVFRLENCSRLLYKKVGETPKKGKKKKKKLAE
jgi:zinc protease